MIFNIQPRLRTIDLNSCYKICWSYQSSVKDLCILFFFVLSEHLELMFQAKMKNKAQDLQNIDFVVQSN